jgi:hypothetical protein
MGQATGQIYKRRMARKLIMDLMSQADRVILIHYSCESFYNRPDGTSPRITSIAVRYLNTGQSTSFSIHQMGERKGYNPSSLEQHYSELEKLMLDEFFEFVRLHQNWNMRDINYGFPALIHRHKVLKGKPVEFDNSKLHDLSSLLINIYGPNYIEHPRLANIVKKNKISDKDFLGGNEEAEAFTKKQYVRLHQSTLRKIYVLAEILDRTANGTLKTNARWRDIYGLYPEAIVEFFQEKWWIVAITAFITAVGFILSFINDLYGIRDLLP